MTKKDLKPLDIVVQREGGVGVYVLSNGEGCILYQEGGYDEVDFAFDDELRYELDGPDFDIMRVYREPHGEILPLDGYEEDGELIYERDRSWRIPTPEEREKMSQERERRRKEEARKWAEAETERRGKMIYVLAQAFYGNRTLTMINEDRIDSFILGYMDSELAKSMVKPEDVDRAIVRIPDTEKLVLIYNRYQDEDNKKGGIRMTANIPELNFVLNSRCIVCRMNEDGSFASIKDEDFEKVMKYLAE